MIAAATEGTDGEPGMDPALAMSPSGDDQLMLVKPQEKNSIGIVVVGTILGNVLEWYDFSV